MGKQWKQWQDFIFLGSKITTGGDCSHKIKRHLLLGRKAITNLDSILKSTDITLPTKVRLVKAMVLPSGHVWMWVGLWNKLSTKELMLLNCGVGEDSWESFGLWGDSARSILKQISLGCSLEGLMLKLKLQYFGHLMQKADSFEKTLMLGKTEGRRRKGRQSMASPTQWTWVWVDSRSWWWTGRPGVLRLLRSQRVGHDWVTELNWEQNIF